MPFKFRALAAVVAVAGGLDRPRATQPQRRRHRSFAPAAPAEPSRRTLHAHRQRRHLQPVRVPRPDADRREARVPGRLRLRAQERLLPRHLGIEHQLAGRFGRVQRMQPGMGHLRRLQAACTTTGAWTSAFSTTTTRAATPGVTKANTTELYIAGNWKCVSLKYCYSVEQHLRRPRLAQRVVPRPDGELPDQRQWTILTPRRSSGVSRQHQRRQQQPAQLHRLEGRRELHGQQLHRRRVLDRYQRQGRRCTPSPARTSADPPERASCKRRSDSSRSRMARLPQSPRGEK